MDSPGSTDAERNTRIHQQEVVADLGQQALETDDLDRLMHDASEIVAETLDNEYCKVLELMPDADEVFLRQGVGWQEGLVGKATVPTDHDSQAGYTLLTEEPVIVEDLRTEERFSGPELLTSHDIVSGISAIIGSVEDPWGVLGTHTTDRRDFTEYDATFVQSIANILASAIENEAAHTELREIHDRITNGILALNGAWEFTHVNHQAEVILGYDADELLGTKIWETFPEVAGTEFEERYREAMVTQESVSFEAYYPPFDAWFEEHVYPSETGLSVYFRDITDQKQMEAELDDIYGRISDAFFALDKEWRFTHLNERAHEWINPKGRELVGKAVWDEFPEATAQQFKEQYGQAMYEQETVSFEEYYSDPLDAWFEVRAYPSETGLSVYFRDITERKERERELERALDLLNKTERIADVAGWEVVPGTRDVFWSDHLFELLDVPYDEQPSLEEALDVYHTEDDRLVVENAVETALDTGEPFDVEARVPRPSGDVGWLRVQGDPEVEDGEVVSLRGAVQDVTQHREREAELERALDLLEKAERVADVGGWEIDVETGDVFWTDHIFELLEVDADEEPPLAEALAMYHEEDQSTVEDAVETALESGDPFDVEVRIQTDSGKVRWLRLQGVPETVDDEVVSFRGAAQDVTDRKQREQRLEELIDKLETSNERLEQFAYAASHDLQEPLRMVSSYLQLIEQRYSDALDEDGDEFLEFAVDGADRMRNMIEGLLQYSRVQTQGGDFEPVDLDAVVADVCADLQVRIEETDAEITADSLPDVDGDQEQLRQLFQNLLENAIEYSGNEPPQVDISAERNGSEWVVSVSDEGIGIDPDHADRVFEVFQRLHAPDDHAGTGIGLALCERIVERHGGDIWIDSEPGEGATVSFTLPAVREPVI